ncbi:FMN-dependent NADH-azoreductase [Aquimarina algicola]|uniref:FMN dependent NADH:quinone oxidoreductase n=1 Tax=Aquimarina algicola TaxID=2589995 RepID=A0A504JPP9_9FLAO|nr:NAD(P)H-dependent oxidoreductase [Aquimarina algicola]TPN88769.1 FMN-dependent NADH-azoreductase [Aquimarina algicola]
MTKVLNIIASPRGEKSKSSTLAKAYLQNLNSNATIDTLELWKENLPEFEANKAAAKMTFFGDGEMDENKRNAWRNITDITLRFTEADHYVFSIPMWNGGIPYKLKQYIDIITQPGLLFGFDPENGYSGLLEEKKATVIYTSGVFSPGADPKYGTDYHSNYFNWWLNMIGIKDIEEIRFQPSLLTANPEKDFQEVLYKINK